MPPHSAKYRSVEREREKKKRYLQRKSARLHKIILISSANGDYTLSSDDERNMRFLFEKYDEECQIEEEKEQREYIREVVIEYGEEGKIQELFEHLREEYKKVAKNIYFGLPYEQWLRCDMMKHMHEHFPYYQLDSYLKQLLHGKDEEEQYYIRKMAHKVYANLSESIHLQHIIVKRSQFGLLTQDYLDGLSDDESKEAERIMDKLNIYVDSDEKQHDSDQDSDYGSYQDSDYGSDGYCHEDWGDYDSDDYKPKKKYKKSSPSPLPSANDLLSDYYRSIYEIIGVPSDYPDYDNDFYAEPIINHYRSRRPRRKLEARRPFRTPDELSGITRRINRRFDTRTFLDVLMDKNPIICAICHEPLQSNEASNTFGCHPLHFHEKCIKENLAFLSTKNKKAKCPMCRTPLRYGCAEEPDEESDEESGEDSDEESDEESDDSLRMRS